MNSTSVTEPRARPLEPTQIHLAIEPHRGLTVDVVLGLTERGLVERVDRVREAFPRAVCLGSGSAA